MKATKKLLAITIAIIMSATVLLFSGCTAKRDDENYLEISIVNLGYGYEWIDDIIAGFENADWVKAKYPELKVEYSRTSERSYANSRIMSGSKSNTIDLFFAAESSSSSYEGSKGQSNFENLEGIYDMEVPGEEVKFKDKMDPSFLKMSEFERKDGTTTYFGVPWVSGMQGMVYNKTVFEQNGWSEPRTTAELVELCDKITTAGKLPFVFSTKEHYWASMMFLIWWAQYEGVDNYANFYKGYVTDDSGRLQLSPDVFKQLGRKRGLETIESLIYGGNNKNVHKDVNEMEFTQAQSKFLLSDGLMMPNGDWFEHEMSKVKAEEGITTEFTFMKTPVISTIVEKLDDKSMTDSTLREVIGAIDAGEASSTKCNQSDFDKIKEARNTVLPLGNHNVFIPSYATAKNIAKDFIRYMATDEACNAFIKKSNGASMPFKYDVKTKDAALYNSLPIIQKTRLELSNNAVYMLNENTFKTVYYGKLQRLSGDRTEIEKRFCAKNAADRKSAQTIYDEEIALWTKDKWNLMLSDSGII